MHASLNVGYQGKSGPGKIHEVILVKNELFSFKIREIENPRWRIQDGRHQKNYIANPDVTGCCHGNQVKLYDVRHQYQAFCKDWSLYLESKSEDTRKTYSCIELA